MESVCLSLSSLINTMSFKNLMIAVMKVIFILMDWNQQINVGTWILADPEKRKFPDLLWVEERLRLDWWPSGCIIWGARLFLVCAALSSPNLWSDLTLRSLGRMGRSNRVSGRRLSCWFRFGSSMTFLSLNVWNSQWSLTFFQRHSNTFAEDTSPLLKAEVVIHVLGALHACHSSGSALSASCFRKRHAGQGRRRGLLDYSRRQSIYLTLLVKILWLQPYTIQFNLNL